MLKFTYRWDALTRTIEATRTDERPFAAVLGQHKPSTRVIRLPFGFTFQGFRADLQRWLDGELVQNALPYLGRDDRAWLTSGPAAFDLPEEEA